MNEFFVRSANETTFPQAGGLVAEVFAENNPRQYERILHDWVANLPQKPRFMYEHCRVGMIGDTVVSQVLIEKETLYYGQAQLKVAIIGKVCTHPDYRHLGYSSALIRDTLAYIAEQGAHLALLNDPGSFYHNFGFGPVLPDTQMVMDSQLASHMPITLKIRSAQQEDLPAIARLYARHWDGRVSFQRPPDWWVWKYLSSIDPILVAVNQADQVQGYLWRENMRAELEIVCDTLQATMSLLAFLGKRMQKINQPLIELLIPPDDAILSFVRMMMSVNVQAIYRYNSGWMARIIDSTALLQALLPEIATHAQSFTRNFDASRLYLNSEADAVEIGLRNDPNARLQLSHRDFIQVMFGSLRPSTLALRDQLPYELIHLLELLFPPRIAAIAPLNWL